MAVARHALTRYHSHTRCAPPLPLANADVVGCKIGEVMGRGVERDLGVPTQYGGLGLYPQNRFEM